MRKAHNIRFLSVARGFQWAVACGFLMTTVGYGVAGFFIWLDTDNVVALVPLAFIPFGAIMGFAFSRMVKTFVPVVQFEDGLAFEADAQQATLKWAEMTDIRRALMGSGRVFTIEARDFTKTVQAPLSSRSAHEIAAAWHVANGRPAPRPPSALRRMADLIGF